MGAIQSDPLMVAAFQASHGLGFLEAGAQVRLRELRNCIEQGTWRVKTDDLDRVLQKEISQHLRRPKPVKVLARALRNGLSMRLRRIKIAIEVQNLEHFDAELVLGPYKFGSVAQLVRGANTNIDTELERGRIARIDPKMMVIIFEAEVPKAEKLETDWLWSRAEQGLNLLAVSHLRRWADTGPAWNLRTGIHGWSWAGSGLKATIHTNRFWMQGYPYGVVHDWLKARQRPPTVPGVKAKGLPRFRTALDAYTGLPNGELKEDFHAAYNALGEAVRLLPQPAASLTLAWAAFERAYALHDRHRRPWSIANCLLLASATKGTFAHPIELVNLYGLRNAAAHQAEPFIWTERGGTDRLGTVYGHIEALLEYCLEEGFVTRTQVTQAIETAEHKAVAASWAEGTRKDLLAERGLAILPSYQRKLDRSLELWRSVEELLMPNSPKVMGARARSKRSPAA